jgi:hypothetical protein
MRIFIANNVPRLSVSGLFFYFVGKGIEKWCGKHPTDGNDQPQKHKHHQDQASARCTFFCRHHYRIHHREHRRGFPHRQLSLLALFGQLIVYRKSDIVLVAQPFFGGTRQCRCQSPVGVDKGRQVGLFLYEILLGIFITLFHESQILLGLFRFIPDYIFFQRPAQPFGNLRSPFRLGKRIANGHIPILLGKFQFE